MTAATSVFSNEALFASYEVELTFEGRLAGSIPAEPQAVWEMVCRQMAKASGKPRDEIARDELIRRTRIFLTETGKNVDELSDDDIEAMAKEDATSGVNVFRRDAEGLWFPSHAIKASLKEAVNVLYAKERWGKTGKGPIGFVAERVFVEPGRIRLVRDGEILREADGVETLQGRVTGPQGPRAIVTQHEYVEAPVIEFRLDVLANGRASEEMEPRWPEIFSYIERNGIGSHRRFTGYSRFVTTRFERVEKRDEAPAKTKKARAT